MTIHPPSRYVILAAAVALLAGMSAAQAVMSSEDVKQRIEKAFPVQVLKIEPGEVDGKAAYFLRVMSKEVVANGGLTVTTLGVDAETGALIPAFRHRASGYSIPETLSGEPREANVPSSGSTWR